MPKNTTLVNVMWFRRDLRLEDNHALYVALKSGLPVIPLFIFDQSILDLLEDKNDQRVAFIHATISLLQNQLVALGSSLDVRYGHPQAVFKELLKDYDIEQVFTNHDYEPYARERDESIGSFLKDHQVKLNTYKDQVIFEKQEIVKEDGKPYTVFTPYSNKWKAKLTDADCVSFPSEKLVKHFFQQNTLLVPSLESMGFSSTPYQFPSKELNESIVIHYTDQRNFPGNDKGTSRLGLHLRFGTVSIRTLTRRARVLNETFLNELIWRDFYHTILWHFPRVGKGASFKPEYDRIEWRNNETEFEAWCHGMTGYPIVDAGMRELNTTGFMHNRVRMIVASFLTKHLLIDWRWGEAYFAQKLLDFDLAANNGGWQWASGSGCDAAPYFRVFNPYLQTEKFDPSFTYIKKWVPEFQELTYPKPIVVHEVARKRVLEVYAKALKK
ncbi:MAG: deoxyribodipyrimidine photo-lyase [Sphingobacteriia bacterium]|nr:MAG: deoxyribodipyrimidine photo-lyase [Sphingobacteriia bacterium]